MAIAYQSNIPIIAMENTGGWAQRLSGSFIDERKRLKVEVASTAKEAVDMAITLANKI